MNSSPAPVKGLGTFWGERGGGGGGGARAKEGLQARDRGGGGVLSGTGSAQPASASRRAVFPSLC